MGSDPLSKCKTCGGDPKVTRHPGDYGYFPASATVSCNCGMQTPRFYDTEVWVKGSWKVSESGEEKAVAVWEGPK